MLLECHAGKYCVTNNKYNNWVGLRLWIIEGRNCLFSQVPPTIAGESARLLCNKLFICKVLYKRVTLTLIIYDRVKELDILTSPEFNFFFKPSFATATWTCQRICVYCFEMYLGWEKNSVLDCDGQWWINNVNETSTGGQNRCFSNNAVVIRKWRTERDNARRNGQKRKKRENFGGIRNATWRAQNAPDASSIPHYYYCQPQEARDKRVDVVFKFELKRPTFPACTPLLMLLLKMERHAFILVSRTAR